MMQGNTGISDPLTRRPDGRAGATTSTEPFCEQCRQETVAVNTGNLVTVNFIGEAFIGRSNRCSRCGSVESLMFFFMLVPLIPLGKWKVKHLGKRRFLARKMMKSSFPDFGRQHLPGRNRILVPLLVVMLLVLIIGVGGVILLNPS